MRKQCRKIRKESHVEKKNLKRNWFCLRKPLTVNSICTRMCCVLNSKARESAKQLATFIQDKRLATNSELTKDKDKRLATISELIKDKDKRLATISELIKEKDKRLATKSELIKEKDKRLATISEFIKIRTKD